MRRVLLKLSGESFAKESGMGIDFDKMLDVASVIKKAVVCYCYWRR